MRFLFALVAALLIAVTGHCQSTVGGNVSPDGTEEIRIDLPNAYHVKNSVGVDGSGLCVWASAAMAGKWQGEESVVAMFDRLKDTEGGGWPQRVEAEMRGRCPGVRYVQHTGGSPEVLKSIVASGRIACITYGYSPRYRGPIQHMVCCVHFSDNWFAVIDCNHPRTVEWMTPAEGLKRWKYGRGGGWCWALSAPPPAPVPVNLAPPARMGQCPGGRCPLPLSPVPCPDTSSGEPVWVQVAPGSDLYDVYQGGQYVGRFPWPGSNRVLPVPLPEVIDLDKRDRPTGVVGNAYAGYGDTCCGRRLAAGEIMAVLKQEGMVPEDTAKPTVSIIGGASQAPDVRRQLEADPATAAVLKRCKVRVYSPTDLLIRDVKLDDGRDFTIVLQGPEGKDGRAPVLHRQPDFAGGPQCFLEAVRKAAPEYVATADPDKRKAEPKKEEADKDPAAKPWYTQEWVWVGGLLILSWVVPAPLRPLVSLAQAAYAARSKGTLTAADLAPILDRFKQLEERLAEKVPKKE